MTKSLKTPAARSVLDLSPTVLLIIDLISDFDFPDGERIFKAALPVARAIRRLKARADRADIATIYVNDNFGRWRSDFRQLVRRCSSPSVKGRPIVELLHPRSEDYFVLKPTHAGFFGTALECLLKELRTVRLIVTGIPAHQCILFTANEAYLRGYNLIIPRDCVGSQKPQQKKFALDYFQSVLQADIRPSRTLRLSRPRQ